jgi:hypothetical protein
MLEARPDPGDAGDGGETGGDGTSFFGDGGDGSDLLLRGRLGFGGTVLMKDLNERTGRSMPTSDDEDMFPSLSGDRIWPRRLRVMPWDRVQPKREKYRHTSLTYFAIKLF